MIVKLKKKQKPKAGKVIRISSDAWNLIALSRRSKETVDGAIRRLLGLGKQKPARDARTYFAIPEFSILGKSAPDVRGKYLTHLIKLRKPTSGEIPEPIRLREIL